MIRALENQADIDEFCRRIAGKPFCAPAMGTHLDLFWGNPGSSEGFYLLPGDAALLTRGRSATLCGSSSDPDTLEELTAFFHFTGVERVTCEQVVHGCWPLRRKLHYFSLAAGESLSLPPMPPLIADGTLTLDRAPAMTAVSEQLFPDEPAERARFYSVACTSIAHGVGRCYALHGEGDGIVTEVGCYDRWGGEAYMSAGETREALRGQGLGGWLIAQMANDLAAAGDKVSFLCEENRIPFYHRLGFVQNGKFYQYNTKGNITE